MTTDSRHFFTSLRAERIRRTIRGVLEIPPRTFHRLPEGLSISPIDPGKVTGCVKHLHLKPGLALRAYQFKCSSNGNGFIYAMPRDMQLPVPKATGKQHQNVYAFGLELEHPRPPAALRHFMEAFEGDGTEVSFLEASILLRELEEFGAVWHGCEWSTHEILDANPLRPNARKLRGISTEDLGAPEEWKWEAPEPDDWRPSVTHFETKDVMLFTTLSFLGTCAFYEHTDVFSSGNMVPKSGVRRLARGRGGFVH